MQIMTVVIEKKSAVSWSDENLPRRGFFRAGYCVWRFQMGLKERGDLDLWVIAVPVDGCSAMVSHVLRRRSGEPFAGVD
jgi:hypothetical protein